MARISGVDLPNDKRVEIGLTYIYGIGRTTSNEIIKATGINPDTRCRDLTEDDVKSSVTTSLTTSQLKVTFVETQHLTLKDL